MFTRWLLDLLVVASVCKQVFFVHIYMYVHVYVYNVLCVASCVQEDRH